MKKLILSGPSIDNSGRYIDAGTEVEIGDGKAMISTDRAATMLKRAATHVPASPAEERG